MTPTQRLIQAALDASGLTAQQLARALGVSLEAVSAWRQGKRTASGPARILLALWATDPEQAAGVCGLAHD